jgi:hypothetical protein
VARLTYTEPTERVATTTLEPGRDAEVTLTVP